MRSAELLDKRRCWKQVVEAKQLLSTLRYEHCPESWKSKNMWQKQPYKNHPARLMWEGFEELLAHYYNCFLWHCKNVHKIRTVQVFIPSKYTIINTECNLLFESMDLTCGELAFKNHREGKFPFWFTNEGFHLSHQARLIEKDRNFYLLKFPEADRFNDGEYCWPDMKNKTFRIISSTKNKKNDFKINRSGKQVP